MNLKWIFKDREEEFVSLQKRHKKLKRDYFELQAQIRDQLPADEIKICKCRGYILKLGKSYIHLGRGNCDLVDGLSVEIITLDQTLQDRLKKEAGELKDLTVTQHDAQ